MRKILCLICAAALIACALPVYGETVSVDNRYTTTGTDAASAGKEIVLLIVKGDGSTINEDNIQYIDQVTADENGYYEFKNYLTKDMPANDSEFKALIGGEAIPEPKEEKVPVITVGGGTVTGVVKFVGKAGGEKATVKLTDVNDASKVYSVLVEYDQDIKGGEFEIKNVAAGTYKVEATKLSHLAYVQENMLMSADKGVVLTIQMYAGDIDSNNVINIYDITTIVPKVGLSSNEAGFESALDLNEDGVINIYDITTIVPNVGIDRQN